MKKKKDEIKAEFPDKRSSGTGTDKAYYIEGRSVNSRPEQIGGMLLDERWRRIDLYEVQHPHGVPVKNHGGASQAGDRGLLNYEAAEALRWWFHAEAAAGLGLSAICLETRLVECEVKYSYEVTAVKEVSVLGRDGSRSYMPSEAK